MWAWGWCAPAGCSSGQRGHTRPGTCASCGTLGFPVGSDPLLRKQGGDQRSVWGPRGLGLGGQTPYRGSGGRRRALRNILKAREWYQRKRVRGPDAPRGGRTSGTRCRVNRASPGRSQSADRECPGQASLRYRQCRIRGRGGGGRGFRGAATAFWNWKGWPRPSLVNVLSAAEVCTSERFKWQLLVLCSAAPQEVAGAGPSRRLPAEVPRKVFSALPHARTFA